MDKRSLDNPDDLEIDYINQRVKEIVANNGVVKTQAIEIVSSDFGFAKEFFRKHIVISSKTEKEKYVFRDGYEIALRKEIDKIKSKTTKKVSSTGKNKSNTEPKKVCHTGNTLDINIEFIKYLESEQEAIKSMIESFKNKGNTKNNTGNTIEINFTRSSNTMISCRSDKAVWERFSEYAKRQININKGDLLANILTEWLDQQEQ